MAIWNGPVRGGNRGGRDQFKWEDVKDMEFKHRECYLGQSLHVDPNWYEKDGFKNIGTYSGGKTVEMDELERVRKADEDAMNEALGLAPKTRVTERELERGELKEALARGRVERDRFDVDRVEGVGFSIAAKPSGSVPVLEMGKDRNGNTDARATLAATTTSVATAPPSQPSASGGDVYVEKEKRSGDSIGVRERDRDRDRGKVRRKRDHESSHSHSRSAGGDEDRDHRESRDRDKKHKHTHKHRHHRDERDRNRDRDRREERHGRVRGRRRHDSE